MVMMNDILAFIEKAINSTNIVINTGNNKEEFEFVIRNNNNKSLIAINIFNNYYVVSSIDYQRAVFEHKLTEREKLTLENFVIDIRELNEIRTVNLFNNFFKDDHKPTINDLDNEND